MTQNRKVKVLLASSMVLAMMANTGLSVANAADTGAKAPHSEKVKPAGIEYQTKGDLKLTGSAMDGLDLLNENTVTRGNLNLRYDVTSLASINWDDPTDAVVKLPEEFNELAKGGHIIKYIDSAHFAYSSTGGGSLDHDYTKDEMSVVKDPESDSYLLKMKNPRISGMGINTKISVNIEMNIGDMVTDSGIRIPNTIDNAAYHFAATLSSQDIIDWEIVGDTNGSDVIPVHSLDPGYDLLQLTPTIEKPVYNTSKKVSGAGHAGAKITIKDNDGKVIGTGVVGDSYIYHVKIKPQKVGTRIHVTQNTGVGESKEVTAIIAQDPKQMDGPTVTTGSTIDHAATKITGTGHAQGDTIRITNDATGQSIETKTIVGNAFVAKLEEGFMKAGDTLSLVEITPAGKESKTTVVSVV